MTSDSERASSSPSSTTSTPPDKLTVGENLSVQRLQSIWRSLTPEKRQGFLKQPGNLLAGAICDSLFWMRHATKSRDDQDPIHPYKPLPETEYFDVLHADWQRERILYVEKSRSMITSWWSAGEALHYVMTHQPSKGIFMAQDQDRAVVLRDYVWTLYEQQHPSLQKLFPVPRPRKAQSFDKLELSDGGLLIALPGKDPDKIRSEHPSLVVFDEACFIEYGGEAFDVALASRVPKVLLISTAAPSWIRRITKNAVPEPLNV